MKHGADRHPEQSFVDNMAERMGDHTGYRQWCADPDSAHHETDLVDDAVGQDAPHVIFEQRVHDAVEGHDTADRYQDFLTGESAHESVDCSLGGVGAENDSSKNSRLGISVRQPTGKTARRRR